MSSLLPNQNRRTESSTHELSMMEKDIWLGILEHQLANSGCVLSTHAKDSIQNGRATFSDFERLKKLENWYPWRIELNDEKDRAREKFVKVRMHYPSDNLRTWKLCAVVAIGKPLLVITIFTNSNCVLS